MTEDVPTSTRRCVREPPDEFEYILTHASSFELRSSVGALLI